MLISLCQTLCVARIESRPALACAGTTTSGSLLTLGTETEHQYTLLGEEQHENHSFFGVQLTLLDVV